MISAPGRAAVGARPTSSTPTSERSSATCSQASTPIRLGSWLSAPLRGAPATRPARSQMSWRNAPPTPRSRRLAGLHRSECYQALCRPTRTSITRSCLSMARLAPPSGSAELRLAMMASPTTSRRARRGRDHRPAHPHPRSGQPARGDRRGFGRRAGAAEAENGAPKVDR
jgi:hypothetical protein